MRKLITRDVPVFCRCLKKVGLKEEVKALAAEANTAEDVWAKGFDFVWNLFDTMTEETGESALYEFLAGPFEMSAEEVQNLEIDVLFTNLEQLAKENNLYRFFKIAARSMK